MNIPSPNYRTDNAIDPLLNALFKILVGLLPIVFIKPLFIARLGPCFPILDPAGGFLNILFNILAGFLPAVFIKPLFTARLGPCFPILDPAGGVSNISLAKSKSNRGTPCGGYANSLAIPGSLIGFLNILFNILAGFLPAVFIKNLFGTRLNPRPKMLLDF
jgi:hypothetical protein